MTKKIFILIIFSSMLFGQIGPTGGSEIRTEGSPANSVTGTSSSISSMPPDSQTSLPESGLDNPLNLLWNNPSSILLSSPLVTSLEPSLKGSLETSLEPSLDGSLETSLETSLDGSLETANVPPLVSSSENIVRGNRIDRSGVTLNPYEHRYIGNVFGEWSSLTGKSSGASPNQGFDATIFGGSLGWERLIGKNILWGYTFHGASIDIDPTDSGYSGRISSFAGDLHLTVFGQQWFIDLLIGTGINWNRNEIIDIRKSRFRTSQWNYNVDCGLRIRQGFTKIEPFLGLHATTLSEPEHSGFSDRNSLIKTDDFYTSCRFLIGGKFHWEHNINLGTVMPHLYGFWTHEFCEETIFTTNDINGFAFAWRFGGNELPINRLNLGIGVTFALRDSFDVYFNYHNTFSSDYSDSVLFGGFNKKY